MEGADPWKGLTSWEELTPWENLRREVDSSGQASAMHCRPPQGILARVLAEV
jgi:hypothetical protein